jgi:hypothetical protein
MTRTDMTELARGFAALAPTRVLWAIAEKGLPDGMRLADLPLGANTLVTPWVDYNVSAVLGQCLASVDRSQHYDYSLAKSQCKGETASAPQRPCVMG